MIRSVAVLALALALPACGDAPTGEAARTPPADGPTASATVARADAAPAPATGAPLQFLTRLEYDAGGKPETVAAADFDGDGSSELVAALLDPGRLVVWRGSTFGPVEPPTSVAIDAWPLAPLVVPAQRFGAPRPRLAVASRATKSLAFVEPLAGTTERVLTFDAVPRAAALGDLGADGRLELAFACDGRALVLVDEAGARTVAQLPPDLPRCVAVLADGSGVVVGFQDSQTLALLTRDAAGALALERELALAGFPRRVAEIDLDRDGDQELVVLGGDRAAWVYGFAEKGGSRAWRRDGARALEWSTSQVPLDLAIGDGDGDGALDLAVLAFADLEAALWCGFDASGPKVTAAGYVGQSALSLTAGDFDGDRALDLAIANRDANRISVVRGDGRGGLVWPSSADVATFPTSIATADLDGDRRAEGVSVSAKLCALDVVRWNGKELERVSRLPIGPAAQALVTADLDGDGHVDAAWITSDAHGAQIELAFGDGTSALASRASEPPLAIGASGEDLVALDLDGDGGLELVAANSEANELCVFRRDAAARCFAAEPARVALGPAPVALAPCGGSPAVPVGHGSSGSPPDRATGPRGELAVALAGPGPRTGVARIALTRDASGAWHLSERSHVPLRGVPLDIAAPRLSLAGGELVVLGSDSRDSANGWLRVVRDGAVVSSRTPGLKCAQLAIGDLDGDLQDDVVVASLNSHAVNLWLGRAGELVPEPNLGAGLGVLDVALGDADGDGRLDVFVANAFGDDVSLVLNPARR
ncbi:MAG: VCBS repeat-containing protein [Planctomycetes bacterium]|nr:VCBS repeat-containing protein [Planctomycetota bacterium]